jgi:hypothetical protein
MGSPQPVPTTHQRPAVARRRRAVLLRAGGIVLLCHIVPAAAVALGLNYRSYQDNCTECGAFDGIFTVVIAMLVAASLSVGLLLVVILVAARMHQPVRVGLIAGSTGIFLTLHTLVTAATSQFP